MTAYCTLGDLLDMMDAAELVRYTDDDGAGEIETAVVDKAIAGAQALVDTFLAPRYRVPLAPPVPDMVAALTVDIALYRLCARRHQAPEEVRRKYDDAVKMLERLSSGKTVLTGISPAASDTSAGRVDISGPARVFSRDTMRGY